MIVSAKPDSTTVQRSCQAEAAIDRQPRSLGPKPDDDLRFSVGIYAISEVATYIGVARSTLVGWIHPPSDSPPLVTSLPRCGEELSIPFIGFVEAFVLQAAHLAGLPRRAIRRGAEAVVDALDASHPLASSALVNPDAVELFVRGATRTKGNLTCRAPELAAALAEHLRAIDYAEDGYAERIRLRRYAPADVVVDPAAAFGLPFIVGTGPRVDDVLDRFRASDEPDSIAYDFGLSRKTFDAIVTAPGA